MHLGLVLAARAHALPQERHRVQAQHVDAGVGELEHRLGHRAEHRGIRVVEVPLVVVERRPHPASELRRPGEVAGSGVREHLRQRRLVGVGLGAIGERAVEREPLGVAGACGRRPRVLARGVVEHDVDAQRHALRAEVGGERAQVVHRAQARVDGEVVDDRVAAVVGLRPRMQQRHQVEVADPELAQVRQALAHAGERAGEAVDVGDVADGLLALQPVRGDLALVVEQLQLRRALAGRARDRVEQRVPLGGEARVAVVERDERVAQLGEEPLQAHAERGVPPHACGGALVLRAHLRAHRVDVLHARIDAHRCAYPAPRWQTRRRRPRGGGTACSTRSTRARSRTPTATGSAICAASWRAWTISSGSASTASGSTRRCRRPNDDWGYDVADYCGVHPDLGTLEDLDALVAARAASAGSACCSTWSRTTRATATRGSSTPSRGRDAAPPRLLRVGRPGAGRRAAEQLGVELRRLGVAVRTSRPASTTCNNFLPSQPDLNWWNDEVRDAFDDVLRFWFERGDRGLPDRRLPRDRQGPRAARRPGGDARRPPRGAQARRSSRCSR